MVEAVRLTGLGARLRQEAAARFLSAGQPLWPSRAVDDGKKQEMPAYDPRAVQGIGLRICHLESRRLPCPRLHRSARRSRRADQDGQGHDRGQGGVAVGVQNGTAAMDSSGACLFTSLGIGAAEYAELMTARPASPTTPRTSQGRRANLRTSSGCSTSKAGLTATDDTLPPRLLNEPIPSGPSKGRGQSPGTRCCRNTMTCAAGGPKAFRPRRSSANWR